MRRGGFTLIELLIVMSIIGVLGAISIFALQGARGSGRDAKRKADLESIASALEIYRSDCDIYPASIPTHASGSSLTASCPTSNTYMTKTPGDPSGSEYSYSRPATTTYQLCATLEDASSYCINNP